MNELVIVKPEKCQGCNACVRVCPAPEANITKRLDEDKFITTINPNKCIACGECIRACQHGARDYIDDTEECMSRVIKEKLIIMVAPAIKAALPTKWKGILNWFKHQGCSVYDVSLGADICTWAHMKMIEQGNLGNIISQPCAAVVRYIETYQPKLLSNLSPIHSPVACEVIYVKQYQRRTNPIAFLSPCIAKKSEFSETGLVDYNVTFEKLLKYFERNGIDIPTNTTDDFQYRFDDAQGQLGSIYSRPGGLRDNILAHNPDINVANSEGAHKLYKELEMYVKMPESKHPKVYDVLSCEFGCNLGPATGSTQSVFDVMTTMKAIENEAKSRRRSGGLIGRGEDKLFKRFDEELRISDFIRTYKGGMVTPVPSDKQLVPIYEKMKKHTEVERNYNCHACGYNSCRDMAIAISRGLNTPENCVVYAKSVFVAKHSELSRQHERLAQLTGKCLELSNTLNSLVDSINGNMETIGKSTAATSERADVVKDLLQNIVTFCNDNPTMDSDAVAQLTSILEMTISAFSTLDDNVSITNISSGEINKSLSEITSLVQEINETFVKS